MTGSMIWMSLAHGAWIESVGYSPASPGEQTVSQAEDSSAGIQYLNTCLTELDSRLGRAGPFSGPVPFSAFSRLDLALALLADAAQGPLVETLAETRKHLRQIYHTLTSVTERCDPDLNPVWQQLADFIEDLLGNLDRGISLQTLTTDSRWRGLADRLLLASGPLGVMDRLENEMKTWVAHRGHGDLQPEVEMQLGARWRQLRTYGDGIFQRGLLADFGLGSTKKS